MRTSSTYYIVQIRTTRKVLPTIASEHERIYVVPVTAIGNKSMVTIVFPSAPGMALITYKETLSFSKGNSNCFLCLSNRFNGCTYTTTIGQKSTHILWIEANQILNQRKIAEVAFC